MSDSWLDTELDDRRAADEAFETQYREINKWPWYLDGYIGEPIIGVDENGTRILNRDSEGTVFEPVSRHQLMQDTLSGDQLEKYNQRYEAEYDRVVNSSANLVDVTSRIAALQSIEDEAAKLEGRKPEQLDKNEDIWNAVWEDILAENHTMAEENASLFGLEGLLCDQDGGMDTYNEMLAVYDQACIDNDTAQILSQQSSRPEIDLVNGALLVCNFGSHQRRLWLKNDHGVRVQGKSQALDRDCEFGKKDVEKFNIGWFGHCSCPNNCGVTEELAAFTLMSPDGVNLEPLVREAKEDIMCDIDLTSTTWNDTVETRFISYNGRKWGKRQVPTLRSYLMCKYGGIIWPITAGQQDVENAWTPPWLGCMFEEGTGLHYSYCMENGICPYRPGTSEYDAWYTDKLVEDFDMAATNAAQQSYIESTETIDSYLEKYEYDMRNATDMEDLDRYYDALSEQSDAFISKDYRAYDDAKEVMDEYLWGLYASGAANDMSASQKESAQAVLNAYYNGVVPQPTLQEAIEGVKNRYASS